MVSMFNVFEMFLKSGAECVTSLAYILHSANFACDSIYEVVELTGETLRDNVSTAGGCADDSATSVK